MTNKLYIESVERERKKMNKNQTMQFIDYIFTECIEDAKKLLWMKKCKQKSAVSNKRKHQLSIACW